jgi:hypothetical protein
MVCLLKRVIQFVILLVASWCVMTFTHESGHIVGGWLGGGTLKDADLLPWHLPFRLRWIPSSLYPCALNINGEGDEVRIGEIPRRVTQAWPPGCPRTADGAGFEVNVSWSTACSP